MTKTEKNFDKNFKYIEVKKTKTMIEEIQSNETETFLNSLKANEPLKKVLFLAKNVSKKLMVDIVPKMSKSVNALMIEINSGKNTSLKDWNTIKFLRQHLYNLSNQSLLIKLLCDKDLHVW